MFCSADRHARDQSTGNASDERADASGETSDGLDSRFRGNDGGIRYFRNNADAAQVYLRVSASKWFDFRHRAPSGICGKARMPDD